MNELLQVQNLEVSFRKKKKRSVVLDGIDLAVKKGEIHGLVGESGSGKTVTALAILRLLPRNGNIMNGKILWKGDDWLPLSTNEMLKFRGKSIAMIFQNPQMSLNPLYTVEQQMTDIIRLHHGTSKAQARKEALHWLNEVGLPEPEKRIQSYAHELSGGMCQRVLIAMALSCKPQLLIADEPTAALDVTIQAQILDLLLQIRDRFGMAILLISHDLGVIARTCDRVTVMYLGKIMETAPAEKLYNDPLHPYTQALLQAVPLPDPSCKERLQILKGDVEEYNGFHGGCRFQSRCVNAMEQCKKKEPPLLPGRNEDSHVACWLYI